MRDRRETYILFLFVKIYAEEQFSLSVYHWNRKYFGNIKNILQINEVGFIRQKKYILGGIPYIGSRQQKFFMQC